MPDIRIGIYEKALPETDDWHARMAYAADAGFDFIEIAIDESPERLNRLNWSRQQRCSLLTAAVESGVPVYNLILSAHRKYPLGSASAKTREFSLDIMRRAIDFAVETGIRVIQLSGYFVFYEPHDDGARKRFRDGLQQGVEWASQAGVTLALENMDGEDIVSLEQAMRFVEFFESPWLQVYPDIGNLAGNNLDVSSELRYAEGHMAGIHLKDARRGEFRRVPFGEGIVPFVEAFRTLSQMNYSGNFLIEMWNDGAPNADEIVSNALIWIKRRMMEGGLIPSKCNA